MMKKTVIVLVSVLALLVGACSQIPGLTPTPGTGPTINPDDLFQTAVAQTLTARATLPPGAVTETATAVASPVLPATDTATLVASPITDIPAVTQTPTPVVDLSATPVTATGNVLTATSIPANGTFTATLA